MRLIMGYVYAIANYLKTEKCRHDLFDYVRAMVIMAAVMAVIRISWDMAIIYFVYQ